MTAESCRECALDLRKQVDEQAIEIARLQERLAAAQDEVKRAANRDQKWRDESNHAREQINRERVNFATNERMNLLIEGLDSRVTTLEARHREDTGTNKAMALFWDVAKVAIGVGLGFALHFLK